MNDFTLRAIAKGARQTVLKRSPEILTGIGIAGMLTTTIMAVRTTPKVLSRIKERERAEGIDFEDLSIVEKAKTAGVYYIPSVVTGGLSVLCLIGACSINSKRRAALAAAYSISETALKAYQGKVIETIGEKKEEKVRDAIVRDEVERNPVALNEVVVTKKGETLCYDAISGRYFKSDMDAIKKAENIINRMVIDDGFAALNDFYYELGLNPIKLGEDLGWRYEDGCVDLRFCTHLSEDGTPCLVIDYRAAPKYNY